MTPREITLRLIELKCIFQAQPKNDGKVSNDLLWQLFGGRPDMPQKEDFSQLGYNSEEDDDEENGTVDIENKDTPKYILETITDPKELIKHEAWFLGMAPLQYLPSRLSGQMMSIGIVDRNLLIRLEDIPWGLAAGEIKVACEYITNLDVKNGTLLITSKVGNVALQIHEITESQCII